ncbi:MAG TPA: cupin domain-containing protein [Candidatus Acidoferrales bacterium]|nr:cupin domain-containing protein [Candidatus Acidoferrales bacterium]
MERRAILQSLIAALAIGSMKSAPDAVQSKEGLLVPFGQNRGRPQSRTHFIISGTDNGGGLAMIGPGGGMLEQVKAGMRALLSETAPDRSHTSPNAHEWQKQGIPVHIHYHQDEYWYTIAGEHMILIGDKKFHAKAGDMVLGPRGVPHSPLAVKPGSVGLTMWQPAGSMEAFFYDLQEAQQKARTSALGLSHDVLAALFKKHGMKLIGPPPEP